MTVRISRLPNGLTVATDRMNSVETASIGVWVGAGTRNERPEWNGIAHMLEHMAFKGTKRRTASRIAEEIEAVGGQINAYTSREHTAYYAKVLYEHMPLAIDILSDIVQHSVFDQAELERERGVVLQEIGQAVDTPDDIVFDHFQAAAYPDQPMGRSVLGTVSSVRGIGREALFCYMNEEYGSHRTVLSAAGRVDHEEIVALSARLFQSLPMNGVPRPEASRYAGGDLREDRDLEQLHLVLGFPGVPVGHDDYYAVSALSVLFGGGMSSRLFQEVREKRGLAYSVYSFASSYTDSGIFGIYGGTSASQAAEFLAVTAGEAAAVAEKVGEDELARARAQLKASTLMALESTGARAERLGQNLLCLGRVVPVEEIVDKIEAVDRAAIARVARNLLTGPLTVAAIGPLDGLADYDRIAARFH
jgi:predicted Zn-dependent peptidase